MNSLTSVDGQRGYGHAIDEFVGWYCSEPRLALSRTVVLRYRSYVEARLLAPGTIKLRLGAVLRLHAAGGELEQIQYLLGYVSIQTTERYLGCKQRIRSAVNDRIGIEPCP